METGLKIIGFPKDPKPYMRPMGYDNRISFGFGAFFATYMNMSNNCPLAYWWGGQQHKRLESAEQVVSATSALSK